MDSPIKVYKTKDGSNTLLHEKFNEIYHSRNGALSESLHVFIKMGLHYFLEQKMNELKILEVGFGTGLNCFLTFLDKLNKNKVYYKGVDIFPLDWQTVEPIYKSLSEEFLAFKTEYQELINAKWNQAISISENFKLKKVESKIEDLDNKEKFDLIYFDAFAPNVQPELWQKNVFDLLFSCLEYGGILVTYCAKGEVRRTLESAGFTVERLPGPPGKREMLRGIK